MPIRYVVSDWSGSFVPNADEGPLWKHVGEGLLSDALRHANLYRVGRLVIAKRELGKAKAAYARGEMGQEAYERAMYSAFNRCVLAGAPVRTVRSLVDGYAQAAAKDVDERLAGPVFAALREGAVRGLCIVSGGLTENIEAILRHAGYPSTPSEGVAVHANAFLSDRDQRIVRFGPEDGDIYSAKRGHFACATNLQDYRPSEVAAIVDDERDNPNIVTAQLRGVRLVVAFHAEPAFKERLAREGAFVPEDRMDFETFLRGA